MTHRSRAVLACLLLAAASCGDPASPDAGTIQLVAITTGIDPDVAYLAAIDDGPWQLLPAASGAVSAEHLTPGSHTVHIAGVATNCQLGKPAARTVTVPAAGTVLVPVGVSCSATVRRILFGSTRDGAHDLYTMDADGFNVTRVTSVSNNLVYDAAWSPDGSKIAFVSTQPNDHTYNIYVMDSDGRNRKQLTHDSLGAVQPSWSSDGTRIAFSAETAPRSINIFTMASDGSDVRQLTHNAEEDESPTWSPGGGRIAYCKNGSIYIMKSDGSQSAFITTAASSTSPCTLDWGRGAEPEFNPAHSMSRGGRRGT